MRKLESEPATREVTPINVPRMSSVPLKKRKVFDGVQVPTFREISHRKMVQKAETRKNTLCTRQGPMSVSHTSSPCSAQRERTPPPALPPSVGSDKDNLDWENLRVDATLPGKCNFCTGLDVH